LLATTAGRVSVAIGSTPAGSFIVAALGTLLLSGAPGISSVNVASEMLASPSGRTVERSAPRSVAAKKRCPPGVSLALEALSVELLGGMLRR
jgi:hypothetical protein